MRSWPERWCILSIVAALALCLWGVCGWWRRAQYEDRLAYYFGELHEQGGAERREFTLRLAREIPRWGHSEVRRAFDLLLSPRGWRNRGSEFQHELLYAMGAPAAAEALRRLRDSIERPNALSREEILCFDVLAVVANRPVPLPGQRATLADGTWRWAVDAKEKALLLQDWNEWWQQHGRQEEVEWFVGQLVDSDLGVRKEAIRRLEEIFETDLGYSPSAERDQREQIHEEWMRRWESLPRRVRAE